MSMRLILFVFGVLHACVVITQPSIKGISFVATSQPIHRSSLQEISDINANYISVIPYGFSRIGEPKLWYNMEGQWWGETMEGVRKTIEMAHEEGLSVMLKPQVYVPGSWIGAINFESEKDWHKWETDYSRYIMDMAKMANDEGVALFCIGTEAKISVNKRRHYWINLIDSVRTIYCGEITYSANWDNFATIDIWDKLDYIGISSYFPLSDKKTPSVEHLVRLWQPINDKMEAFFLQYHKQILFTEYGYMSVDGCAGKTWELEKKVKRLNINEGAQANALHALYKVFYNTNYWAGGFLWKWFPHGQGHEGYIERDYTPQGKKSQITIQNWFSK